MAKKQLKDLTVATAIDSDDILHMQNVVGFDRQITKEVLLKTTQDQIDSHTNDINNTNSKIDKVNVLETEDDGFIAVTGDDVVMNNSTTTATLNLPATPSDGEWVNVSGINLYSNFSVFVVSSDKDIMVTSDKSCELDGDADGAIFRFWFDNVSDKWKVRKFAIEGVIQ